MPWRPEDPETREIWDDLNSLLAEEEPITQQDIELLDKYEDQIRHVRAQRNRETDPLYQALESGEIQDEALAGEEIEMVDLSFQGTNPNWFSRNVLGKKKSEASYNIDDRPFHELSEKSLDLLEEKVAEAELVPMRIELDVPGAEWHEVGAADISFAPITEELAAPPPPEEPEWINELFREEVNLGGLPEQGYYGQPATKIGALEEAGELGAGGEIAAAARAGEYGAAEGLGGEGIAVMYPQYAPSTRGLTSKDRDATINRERMLSYQGQIKSAWDFQNVWVLVQGYWYGGVSRVTDQLSFNNPDPKVTVDYLWDGGSDSIELNPYKSQIVQQDKWAPPLIVRGDWAPGSDPTAESKRRADRLNPQTQVFVDGTWKTIDRTASYYGVEDMKIVFMDGTKKDTRKAAVYRWRKRGPDQIAGYKRFPNIRGAIQDERTVRADPKEPDQEPKEPDQEPKEPEEPKQSAQDNFNDWLGTFGSGDKIGTDWNTWIQDNDKQEKEALEQDVAWMLLREVPNGYEILVPEALGGDDTTWRKLEGSQSSAKITQYFVEGISKGIIIDNTLEGDLHVYAREPKEAQIDPKTKKEEPKEAQIDPKTKKEEPKEVDPVTSVTQNLGNLIEQKEIIHPTTPFTQVGSIGTVPQDPPAANNPKSEFNQFRRRLPTGRPEDPEEDEKVDEKGPRTKELKSKYSFWKSLQYFAHTLNFETWLDEESMKSITSFADGAAADLVEAIDHDLRDLESGSYYDVNALDRITAQIFEPFIRGTKVTMQTVQRANDPQDHMLMVQMLLDAAQVPGAKDLSAEIVENILERFEDIGPPPPTKQYASHHCRIGGCIPFYFKYVKRNA